MVDSSQQEEKVQVTQTQVEGLVRDKVQDAFNKLVQYLRDQRIQFDQLQLNDWFSQNVLHKLSVWELFPQKNDTSVQNKDFQLQLFQPTQGQYRQDGLEFGISKQYELKFTHVCLATGCDPRSDMPQCTLCMHNPNRKCQTNFDRKYLVNDVLKAKCGANIYIDIVNSQTQKSENNQFKNINLELSILDGTKYDQQSGEYKCVEDIFPCQILINNKQQALLVSHSGSNNSSIGHVVVPFTERTDLPELHVTDSSEAILSGRKPPFRLFVRAINKDGAAIPQVKHAVSEAFVVATRRTRTAGKADIPSVEDHVSKLEHMGKETVKKLQDLGYSARDAGLAIDLPPKLQKVVKVGDFQDLVRLAEQDGHLRQKLQQLLKLSKEKWDDARHHAIKAVISDSRMRAWFVDEESIGLLFTCRMGAVDLDKPVGLIQMKNENSWEVTPTDRMTHQQRQSMQQLHPLARQNWWLQGHPGWQIFPIDSEAYHQSGEFPVAGQDPEEQPADDMYNSGYDQHTQMQQSSHSLQKRSSNLPDYFQNQSLQYIPETNNIFGNQTQTPSSNPNFSQLSKVKFQDPNKDIQHPVNQSPFSPNLAGFTPPVPQSQNNVSQANNNINVTLDNGNNDAQFLLPDQMSLLQQVMQGGNSFQEYAKQLSVGQKRSFLQSKSISQMIKQFDDGQTENAFANLDNKDFQALFNVKDNNSKKLEVLLNNTSDELKNILNQNANTNLNSANFQNQFQNQNQFKRQRIGGQQDNGINQNRTNVNYQIGVKGQN